MSTGWTAPGAAAAAPSADRLEDAAPGSVQDPSRPTGPSGPQRELVTRVPLFPPRPLGVGEVLSAAVRIYRVKPRLGLGVAAIVHGISFAVITLLTGASMVPMMAELEATIETPEATEATTSALSLVSTLLGSLVTGVITLVAASIVGVALTRMALDAAVERPVDRGCVTAAIRKHWWRAVLVSLLTSVLATVIFTVPVALSLLPLLIPDVPWWIPVTTIILAIVLGVLAAVYVYTRFVLAVPALVAEDLGVVMALKRSLRMTAGRRVWRTLGITALLAVVYYLAVQLVASMLGAVAFVAYIAILLVSSMELIWLAVGVLVVISMLGSYIATVLLAPFLAAGFAALYADVRMRHESWDIELQRALRANLEQRDG